MNKVLAYTILILLGGKSFAQSNLVPNPSFENYSSCPDDLGQMYRVNNWSSYGATSDFFHKCSSAWFADIPYNLAGYQSPASGNAYSGLIAFSTSVANDREYIGVPLTIALSIGIKYYVSFKISRAYNTIAAIGGSSDKLGVRFLMSPFDSVNSVPLFNSAHIYSTNIITDTTNWTIVNGTFISDSAYPFLTIGNFFDDNNTNVTDTNIISTPDVYYYIDDVCVSTDSIFCNQFVGLSQNNPKKEIVKVFPNPASVKNTVTIRLIDKTDTSIQLYLYNSIGQLIQQLKIDTAKSDYFVSNLRPGLYFLSISSNSIKISKKIIITP